MEQRSPATTMMTVAENAAAEDLEAQEDQEDAVLKAITAMADKENESKS